MQTKIYCQKLLKKQILCKNEFQKYRYKGKFRGKLEQLLQSDCSTSRRSDLIHSKRPQTGKVNFIVNSKRKGEAQEIKLLVKLIKNRKTAHRDHLQFAR